MVCFVYNSTAGKKGDELATALHPIGSKVIMQYPTRPEGPKQTSTIFISAVTPCNGLRTFRVCTCIKASSLSPALFYQTVFIPSLQRIFADLVVSIFLA